MESSGLTDGAHPRPQFARDEWFSLNGLWDFGFDDGDIGENRRFFEGGGLSKKIKVPFVYQCRASLIGDTAQHTVVWYRRDFTVPEKYAGRRVIINFGGVDYSAKVWINGRFAGSHCGANTSFSLDITELAVSGTNTVALRVQDSASCRRPRGKQRWTDENFLCWYTQSTGIWKNVWLEFPPRAYIKSVRIRPDIDSAGVYFEYDIETGGQKGLSLRTDISFGGVAIRSFTVEPSQGPLDFTANIYSDALTRKVMTWGPGNPNLYDVKFTLTGGEAEDRVSSYFGMRKISTANGKVFLNDSELYQKLILEQGYWKDSLLTAPDEAAIEKDIDLALAMGFNGMRIHQKTEDERFLYACDRKGMLVYSEMASQYEFCEEAVQNLTGEWLQIVRQQYNHPSVIAWVPFNESWGVQNIRSEKREQAFADGICSLTRALDGTRPVISNDGWEHTSSDLITIHDYDQSAEAIARRYADMDAVTSGRVLSSSGRAPFADGYAYSGQPVLISEFGGIAFDSGNGWGYGKHVSGSEEFLERLGALTNAIKDNPRICGYCYTQLTDVQQEVNGLLTEDRQPKADIKKIAEINRTGGFSIT